MYLCRHDIIKLSITMNRVIFTCLLGIALSACTPKVSISPFIQEAYLVNYNEIAGPDFLITESNSVSFDYIGIGSLVVYEETGDGVIVSKSIRDNDGIYDNMKQYEVKGIRRANIKSALERAVNEAKIAGGDAIINLVTQAGNGQVTVSGMVVKRK